MDVEFARREGAAMSLPDYLLEPDDEEGECERCGVIITKYRRLCGECRTDNTDLYADAKIQDAKVKR